MVKHLTLFDCTNKRWRVSEPEESDICDDAVICEIIHDSDADVSSGSTANLTSTTDHEVRGDSHLELPAMNDQVSGDVRTDFCVHGSPSSVDNDTKSESNAENEVLDIPGSSYGNTTLVLHGQYESNSASVCPADIAQSPAFPPVQPVNVQFLKMVFGNRSRSFNPAWYGNYEWLVYSVRLNACFCYPCRLFGSHVVSLAAILNQISPLMDLRIGNMQLVQEDFE